MTLNGKLSGTRIDIKGNQDNKRSLQGENESADILVENGYNVEQNPLTTEIDNIRKEKQPDYRIISMVRYLIIMPQITRQMSNKSVMKFQGKLKEGKHIG